MLNASKVFQNVWAIFDSFVNLLISLQVFLYILLCTFCSFRSVRFRQYVEHSQLKYYLFKILYFLNHVSEVYSNLHTKPNCSMGLFNKIQRTVTMISCRMDLEVDSYNYTSLTWLRKYKILNKWYFSWECSTYWRNQTNEQIEKWIKYL